ncbi:MAG: YXWGXW repeat-containing protein [Bacteroidetes bacterium]|nr:YXWGXW repeat-containing protein [Bacteroidota bacterium]
MKKVHSILFIAVMIFISSCGPSGAVVRVRPEAPVYIRHAAPGPGYVWADGDWVWQRNRYVYRQGYYIKATPYHSNYIPGHWDKRRRGWIWIPGRWR